MIVIGKVDEKGEFACEIVGCRKSADLEIFFEDGGEGDDRGYICQKCHDEHIQENFIFEPILRKLRMYPNKWCLSLVTNEKGITVWRARMYRYLPIELPEFMCDNMDDLYAYTMDNKINDSLGEKSSTASIDS